jgi:hypothetical protein
LGGGYGKRGTHIEVLVLGIASLTFITSEGVIFTASDGLGELGALVQRLIQKPVQDALGADAFGCVIEAVGDLDFGLDALSVRNIMT